MADQNQTTLREMANARPQTTVQHECPLGTSPRVWAGACALAEQRHGNANYPQPRDLADAQIVVVAALRFEEQFSVWR
jgi:hypothetical protein